MAGLSKRVGWGVGRFLRYVKTRFYSLIGYTLIFVSMALSAAILFPVVQDRLPIRPLMPQVLTLSGSVVPSKAAMAKMSAGSIDATVSVGGFMTTTKTDGSFDLVFAAKRTDHIPVVLEWNRKTQVQWISFPAGVRTVTWTAHVQ